MNCFKSNQMRILKILNRSFFYLFFLLIFSVKTSAQEDITINHFNGAAEIKASKSVRLVDGFFVPAGSNVRIYTSSFEVANFNPSLNQNYKLIRSFKVPGINKNNINISRSVYEESQSIDYFDGLGRPMQSVVLKASPTFSDVIQTVAYDEQGLTPFNYLPYTNNSNGGAYRPEALNPASGVSSFYNNPPEGIVPNPSPYSRTLFELSDLNRPSEQGAPGASWQPITGGHTIKSEYKNNNKITSIANPNFRGVKLYKVNAIPGSASTILADGGWYNENELYLNIVKAENWQQSDGRAGTTETYTDKFGRTLLKRIWEDVNTPLSTYYVHDKFGNVCFVLPPKADPDLDNVITQMVLDNLCYQYRFDQDNRVVEKKIPGAGWLYSIYNKLDQLVFSQDGNQRNKTPQEWAFAKYDALGRMIISGVYQHGGSVADGSMSAPDRQYRDLLQAGVNNQSLLWEKRDDTSLTGYSNSSLPTGGIFNYLTISYFDNYSVPGLPVAFDKRNEYSIKTEGLSTVQKIAILNDPTKMLWSVKYYDNEGRNVKLLLQHYKGGVINENNYDEVTNVFDFIGQLTQSTRKHKVDSMETVINNFHEYDHTGRNLSNRQNINNQGEITINKFIYNELGQVKTKYLHSTDGSNFLLSTDYTYNERGWLKSSSNNLFKLNLKYDDGALPQFNGNISGFKSGTNLEKEFNYEYDKLNRLTSGNSSNMVENDITYDKMGNIKTMTRDGQQINYTYNANGFDGNQLQSVFGNGLVNGTYTYDLNGNTTTDGSKNNIQISYNLLNLPQNISGNQTITYTYDAAGGMLSKRSAATGFTEYLNGIQYTNDKLDFIATGEGRAVNSGGSYLYQYDLTDHLGNVRLTFDKDPITKVARRIQSDDYYPFGKRKSLLPVSLTNQYLFNGKEIQVETGEYDYGARFYNPEIARWNVQDPHSDSYVNLSPYSYVANNPIGFTDPTGMDLNPWIKPIGGTQRQAKWWNSNDPNMMPAGWEWLGNENYNFEGGTLRELEVVGQVPSSIKKRNAAFEEMYEKKKRNLGWFDTSPVSGRLRSQTANEFHERYYAHNEIDPFSGKIRVVGLEDANWVIDFTVTAAYGVGKYAASQVLSRGAAAVVAEEAGEGGLNLFKFGAKQTTTSEGWKTGDRMLKMFDQGSPKLNWKQNSGFLRREMGFGEPILDSYRLPNGNLIPTGGFLNAERSLLQTRGWIYNPSQGAWIAPVK